MSVISVLCWCIWVTKSVMFASLCGCLSCLTKLTSDSTNFLAPFFLTGIIDLYHYLSLLVTLILGQGSPGWPKAKIICFPFHTHFSTDQDEIGCGVEAELLFLLLCGILLISGSNCCFIDYRYNINCQHWHAFRCSKTISLKLGMMVEFNKVCIVILLFVTSTCTCDYHLTERTQLLKKWKKVGLFIFLRNQFLSNFLWW